MTNQERVESGDMSALLTLAQEIASPSLCACGFYIEALLAYEEREGERGDADPPVCRACFKILCESIGEE